MQSNKFKIKIILMAEMKHTLEEFKDLVFFYPVQYMYIGETLYTKNIIKNKTLLLKAFLQVILRVWMF